MAHVASSIDKSVEREDEVDRTELGMMVAGIGQALCYSDIDEAKRIQKIMMGWVKSAPAERRSIYHAYRNDGATTPGLECS